MNVSIAVSFLIEQDDKVLIVEEAKPEIFGKWNFPGGRVEQGETLQSAIARELQEEVGRKAEAVTLIRIYEGIRDKDEGQLGIRFLFKVVLDNQKTAAKFHSDISANKLVTKKELQELVNQHKIRARIYQLIEVCDYLTGIPNEVEVIEITDGMLCPCRSGKKWEECHAE